MKTTLILGINSAIGKAIAKDLLSKGQHVIGISRTHVHDFESDENFEFHLRVDMKELPDLLTMKIDGLVYCPGTIRLKPFRSLKKEDFLEDLDVNVFGAIEAIQKYKPLIDKSSEASVVFFSSVAAQLGMPFHASVAISKGALESLTRALAAELSPNIRVNCIAPSLTQTPLAGKLLSSDDKIEASSQRHPLKRIGQPEDIAKAAVFLLSDSSSWTTGQILHVDGGLSSLKV